jgi:hypothetical protein
MNFLGVQKPTFVTFNGMFFQVFDLYLGVPLVFNSILFLTIFSVLDAPIGGVEVWFGHQEQWSLPLGFGLP